MLEKLFRILTVSAGYRSYLLGVLIAALGVAVSVGVITAEDANQIRHLVEQGWGEVFGLVTTLGGLAVIAIRSGSKSDTAKLAAQVEELRAALELANRQGEVQ